MASLWKALGTEIAALGRLALSMPLRPFLSHEGTDPAARHPRPVVLIHGLLGDPTNFLGLRNHLADHGVRNFISFSYLPRLDFQRLAPQLRRTIETACERTGASEVDVVGHSLGGLIGRYLLETGDGGLVRRLVTLGTPYCARRIPDREVAIFASHDVLVPPPPPSYAPSSRFRIVPNCGHCGLLYQESALRAVAHFLSTTLHGTERDRSRATLRAA
jgi:pimeloyl-ACP methyl ester carboxylesterase